MKPAGSKQRPKSKDVKIRSSEQGKVSEAIAQTDEEQ